ncbi:STAS domain-containing protein [Planomonospora parontospora]|uniref:STAS domain-containing protein n=1 Tax=Planomonospora parontospora TaxID=58119 RepID=UPI001670F22C|nr:STAS domain-containing protein [Planomonospora parontospora]GGL30263.1 anti-sigma factor antagonist [Planomonospora parontospora subsp. antibiotica]GII17725.1 anti-sigma factor antagonist [Planomonospora parontospora subsp. antibiotica]
MTSPPGSGHRPNLTVSLVRRDRTAVVHLGGELDLHTVPVLRDALESGAVWGPPATRAVILDLGGITFCDSSGLGELIAVMKHGQAAGIRLLLSTVPAVMARLLAITGLDKAFVVCPDTDEALRRAAES